jgi:hypothetical protein
MIMPAYLRWYTLKTQGVLRTLYINAASRSERSHCWMEHNTFWLRVNLIRKFGSSLMEIHFREIFEKLEPDLSINTEREILVWPVWPLNRKRAIVFKYIKYRFLKGIHLVNRNYEFEQEIQLYTANSKKVVLCKP